LAAALPSSLGDEALRREGVERCVRALLTTVQVRASGVALRDRWV
jgi:hypothetical protein